MARVDLPPGARRAQLVDRQPRRHRREVRLRRVRLRTRLVTGRADDPTPVPMRETLVAIRHLEFVHLEDAAAATLLAVEDGTPGIYNVVDDEPAAARDWLPVLAQVLDAPPPRRFPAWLARLVAGDAAVLMATESRGASNAKAKRELGWTPRYPTWREGFRAAYAPAPEQARSAA
jgi:nucleoside-diphosphate-sugar epimerase